MKVKTLVLSLALWCAGAMAASAQDSNLGSWKFNEAKSHLPAGMPHVVNSTYEAQGDQIKVTSEGVDGQGNAMHQEWVGKFDGKEYPVTGSATVDSRSYRKVNPHTLLLTNKKDGKVVTRARVVTTPDGKTRTVTLTMMEGGKSMTGKAVYDKQ